MSLNPYKKCVEAGELKSLLLEQNGGGYVLRALLAGAYLTIIGFAFWAIRQTFGADPSGRMISSLFFGVGLSIIVFTGTELFTSNNMYLTASTLARRTSWAQTIRLWSVCYLGNLAGAIFVAALLLGAGAIAAMPGTHALFEGAQHKIDQTAQIIFFKGILANWIVCLAVWVNLHLKEEMARFMAIILIVFVFLILGFEHSIANMGTFAVAYLGNPDFNISGAAHNLLWSTLGNIVGGAVGVALPAWMLNKPAPQETSDIQTIRETI